MKLRSRRIVTVFGATACLIGASILQATPAAAAAYEYAWFSTDSAKGGYAVAKLTLNANGTGRIYACDRGTKDGQGALAVVSHYGNTESWQDTNGSNGDCQSTPLFGRIYYGDTVELTACRLNSNGTTDGCSSATWTVGIG